MKIRALSLSLAAAAALAAGSLNAQSVSFNSTGNGGALDAQSLTGFLTQFKQAGGMEIFWTIQGQATQHAFWGNLGGGIWGVEGTDFSLTAKGSNQAFFSLWDLNATDLSSFEIDAVPGDAVMDTDFPSPGTPGSSLGSTFNYCGGVFLGFCYDNTHDQWDTQATYYNPVGINGHSPRTDIWGVLDVDFGTDFSGSVQFQQDLDKTAGYNSNDPGVPESTVTPEPATMSLMAMGLVGLAASRKRRKKI